MHVYDHNLTVGEPMSGSANEEASPHIGCKRTFCRMLAQRLQQNPGYVREITIQRDLFVKKNYSSLL